ncbi:MAG TPA: hypothetical protein VI168_13375 [Croceibacterium sp.]
MLDALKKRSRALKHKNVVVSVDRILEIEGSSASERVNVRFSRRPHQQFSCVLLAGRSIWIVASERIPKGGWKFEFSDGGRLLPSIDGRGLVELFEKTLSAMFEMDETNLGRLEHIWRPCIAKGLRAI